MLGRKPPPACLPLSVPLLFLLLLFSIPSNSDPSYYYSCPQLLSSCGNLTDIPYPFWFANDSIVEPSSYCGYPDLKLICQNNVPILRLANDSYVVTHINPDKYTISLADADIFFSTDATYSCPRVRHNLTFVSNSTLSYAPSDANITFFFNCTGGPTGMEISCLPHAGENRSYVFTNDTIPRKYDLYRICQDIVVTPILKTYLGIILSNGYESVAGFAFGEALHEGFQLSWPEMMTTGSCGDCEHSGGRCGFKRTSNSSYRSACFCKDGETAIDKCEDAADTYAAKKKATKGIVVGLTLASFALLCLFLFAYILRIRCRKCRDNNEQGVEAILRQFGSLGPKRYKYSEIKRMTKSFSNKLGQGGYGSVFKGALQDGHLVAVKVLSESKGNGEEFINEVASISRTSHVNIVSLLGFCSEGSKRALVYDFMSNGSLEKFIHDDKLEAETQLSWQRLYEIAVGIARGLEYLHRGCSTRIVHFDIKPHNILLDQDFHPKISDFGLAKLCTSKESIISMVAARGTPGYIAPEIGSRSVGVVSSKSDVYSYGMMVLEMVGGRKNLDIGVENTSEIYFPHWVYDNFDRYCELDISRVTGETEEIARKMIMIGLWCIQMRPESRPSMSMAVDMLEGKIRDLQMPPRP